MNWLLKINRPAWRFRCLGCREDEDYPDCSRSCGSKDLYEEWIAEQKKEKKK